MEKRTRRRIPLKLAGTIEGDQKKAVNAVTRDISSIGAFFDSEQTVPTGTEVEVEIVLPVEKLKEIKEGEAKMKVSGTVVRVEEGGVAVLFRGLKVIFSKKDA